SSCKVRQRVILQALIRYPLSLRVLFDKNHQDKKILLPSLPFHSIPLPAKMLPTEALKEMFHFLSRTERATLALLNRRVAEFLVPSMNAERERFLTTLPTAIERLGEEETRITTTMEELIRRCSEVDVQIADASIQWAVEDVKAAEDWESSEACERVDQLYD